jgi:hypothetical protein
MSLIIVIVIQGANLVAKLALDAPGDGRFAAAGATGDADGQGRVHSQSPFVILFSLLYHKAGRTAT